MICHPENILQCPKVIRMRKHLAVSHADDLWTLQDVIRMTYDVALCHSDEITNMILKSSGWLPSISSGWLMADALCHPDDLAGDGISPEWVTANSLCHPDDILFHRMPSGLVNWVWYLIRMSSDNVIMSSGWHTLPFLSYPDEIANFDFPQHAVALQRFHAKYGDIAHCGRFCSHAEYNYTKLGHAVVMNIWNVDVQ